MFRVRVLCVTYSSYGLCDRLSEAFVGVIVSSVASRPSVRAVESTVVLNGNILHLCHKHAPRPHTAAPTPTPRSGRKCITHKPGVPADKSDWN